MASSKKSSFVPPKSLPTSTGGTIKGMKNCGGFGGRTTQPGTKPHKGKTNP